MLKNILRVTISCFMILAGVAHLTFQREEFQAQVPNWIPFSKDFVVVASGIIEIVLGAGLLFIKKYRSEFGLALAIFFILIFPGNIAQYINRTDAFGLDTDTKRFARLFFQPVLIFWALYSSNAIEFFRNKK